MVSDDTSASACSGAVASPSTCAAVDHDREQPRAEDPPEVVGQLSAAGCHEVRHRCIVGQVGQVGQVDRSWQCGTAIPTWAGLPGRHCRTADRDRRP